MHRHKDSYTSCVEKVSDSHGNYSSGSLGINSEVPGPAHAQEHFLAKVARAIIKR